MFTFTVISLVFVHLVFLPLYSLNWNIGMQLLFRKYLLQIYWLIWFYLNTDFFVFTHNVPEPRTDLKKINGGVKQWVARIRYHQYLVPTQSKATIVNWSKKL